MERRLKMFLFVIFWTLIGLGIAFMVDRRFWWVGLIVGTLAGYVTYEWRTVAQTAGELLGREARAVIGRKLMAILTILFWMWSWVAVASYPNIYADYTHTAKFLPNLLASVAAVGGAVAVIAGCVMLFFVYVSKDIDGGDTEDLGRYVFLSSSLVAIFAMLPYGIFLIAKNIKMVGGWIGRFAWKLLLAIHSEDRLIVSFSIAVGIAGGYVAKSFIVGAVTGSLIMAAAEFLIADRWLRAKGYLPRR